MQKKIILSAFVVSIAIAITLLVYFTQAKLVKAPEITLTLLDGKKVPLSVYRNKLTLVVFWSTTCEICIKEMPELNRLQSEYGNRGLTLIGITMPHDDPRNVIFIAQQMRLQYDNAVDIDSSINNAFGTVPFTPTFVLINSEGYIIATEVGEDGFSTIRNKLINLFSIKES